MNSRETASTIKSQNTIIRNTATISPIERSKGADTLYSKDLQPLIVVFKILGLTSFYRNISGAAECRTLSPYMLYSVLVQGCVAVAAGFVMKARIDYLLRVNPEFGEFIIEATFIAAFAPIFLSVIIQLPESGKKRSYLNSWTTFQESYEATTHKPLDLKVRRLAKVQLVVILFVTTLITSFPYLIFEEIRFWYAIPFFYSICLSVLNTGLWYINGCAISNASRTLTEDVEESVTAHDFNCAQKILDYKMLWLKLSKITQEKGQSMGFTYGAQVICYFAEQVMAVYGLLINMREGMSFTNAVFVGCIMIFSWLIFITCNTAQRVTQEVGTVIQEKLQDLCYKIPRNCIESKQEMREFVQTIIENPPVVNFCGFVVVNRGLYTSLISAMVTYLIVLVQFQISTEAPTQRNKTCNYNDM